MYLGKEKLKNPDAFSEELLSSCLAGLSGRQYREVIARASESFGVSPTSVSRKVILAGTKKLTELVERKLGN